MNQTSIPTTDNLYNVNLWLVIDPQQQGRKSFSTNMRDTSILDNFVTAVEQQDTHKRLKAAEEIITYVNDPENPFDFPGVDRLIDGLLGWAGSSNFKVCGEFYNNKAN